MGWYYINPISHHSSPCLCKLYIAIHMSNICMQEVKLQYQTSPCCYTSCKYPIILWSSVIYLTLHKYMDKDEYFITQIHPYVHIYIWFSQCGYTFSVNNTEHMYGRVCQPFYYLSQTYLSCI